MKDGFSMQEIEEFGKTHKQTILFTALLLLSAIFNTILWDGLSIWLIALGAIAGLCFPEPISKFLAKSAILVCKQERTVRLIVAGVSIAVAVIFPPLFFLITGLIAGVATKSKGALFKGKEKKETPEHAEKKPEEKKEGS